MSALRRLGVVVDVRPPPAGNEIERCLVGQDAPVFRIELTEQVNGPEQGRIPRRLEREGVDELGSELAEVGVAALEEVEVVVIEGSEIRLDSSTACRSSAGGTRR